MLQRGNNSGVYMELEKLKSLIRELCDEDNVILVEGKKDREALRKIGVRGKIIEISDQKLFELPQKISKREVIVLVDFDPRGKELVKECKRMLEAQGLRVDLSYRWELHKALGVNRMEELPKKLAEAFKKEMGGERKWGKRMWILLNTLFMPPLK